MDINNLYITYGADQIPFELHNKKQESHRITIKVNPDCQVIVFAPPAATTDEIVVAVNKRARWVYNKLQIFKNQQEQILLRQYISGEAHYYLGRRFVLKVIDNPFAIPHAKLVRGQLQVTTNSEKPQTQLLLSSWYEQKAREVFERRLSVLLSETHWVSSRPTLAVKFMKTRWGCCSSNGKITLNIHLVKAPTSCIDYVILHELCHIAEHNHSQKFYRLLKQVNPNWEKTKYFLDQKASIYLSM